MFNPQTLYTSVSVQGKLTETVKWKMISFRQE